MVLGAALASAVIAVVIFCGAAPAGAATRLAGQLSQTPVSWTPNVFAGTSSSTACDQWFGPGGCRQAMVWSTAIVNGEVVVAGAFTEACEPGPGSSGHCAPGTEVTRDDLFAYQLGTGTIDPHFAPQLNQGPAYSVVAGPHNTVFVGGAFTAVNGTSDKGVVRLNVTPGDASTDGTVVSKFKASVSGFVRAMAIHDKALYIGGQFSRVDGTAEEGVARLKASTGAVDASFSMAISDPPNSGQALKVEAMSLTANGKVLAMSGPFLDVNGQPRPRLALINTGGGFGHTATLADWAAPILNNDCSAEHDYVRAVAFSPHGSYLVIADTGYESSPRTSASVCDAAAKFPTAQTGTNVAPAWINYTGGDSSYSVQDTGAVIYLGGHNRWANNECGDNHACAHNSVLTMGFTAIDANTGLAIPWFHPLTLRGNGTMSMTAFPTGLYPGSNGGILIGNDVVSDGGGYHSFNALFPLASTTTAARFGSIPSGMFSQGNIGGYDESGPGVGVSPMCMTDNSGSVQLSTCTNGSDQNWTVRAEGKVMINGRCLGTVGQRTRSGTRVNVAPCGLSHTQVWTQGAGNTLVNKASGLCVTDPSSSTTSGTVLQLATCSTGATNQVWPLPSAPRPTSLTPTGVVYSTANQSDSQPPCLTDVSGSAQPGTDVELETCTGGSMQNVTAQPNGNLKLNGQCLDTAGEATASGTAVVLNSCGSSPTQVWSQQGPGQTLQNKGAPGMCLDAPSATKGTALEIATCSSSQQTQQWWLPSM